MLDVAAALSSAHTTVPAALRGCLLAAAVLSIRFFVQTLEYPGIYDNVLSHPGSPVYDSSPHVWTHGQPCDITPDPPYSSYTATDAVNTKLGFLGGAGIEGGQGNSDSIYGSHDDHSTYGVSGSGWQGPGNGEAPGNLWNPAVSSSTSGIMAPTQQLATPVALASGNTLAAIDEEQDGSAAPCKTSKSSPGHVILMGHAMILGALSATKDVADHAVQGDFSVSWSSRFSQA